MKYADKIFENFIVISNCKNVGINLLVLFVKYEVSCTWCSKRYVLRTIK